MKVVTTLDEVINDPDVDLVCHIFKSHGIQCWNYVCQVVVAVKDHAHYEYSKAALSAGKHGQLPLVLTFGCPQYEQ